jgi:hypothetical protein
VFGACDTVTGFSFQYEICKKHLIPAVIIVAPSIIEHPGGMKLLGAKHYEYHP